MEGSELIYENADVTKKLIIIGPGYFLDENPKTSNIQLETNIGTINFSGSSAGSQIMGMHIHNNFNGRKMMDSAQAFQSTSIHPIQ